MLKLYGVSMCGVSLEIAVSRWGWKDSWWFGEGWGLWCKYE